MSARRNTASRPAAVAPGGNGGAVAPRVGAPELFDEVAYGHDGTLEGLLTAVFEAYARHEDPTDIAPDALLQPRLSQRISIIPTDMEKATRVRNGLVRKGGWSAFNAVKRASCSSDPEAGNAVYRFVRYVMDEYTGKRRPYNNISHPSVSPVFRIVRSVNQECEHMRQFIRFEHMRGDGADLWYARCNPRDSVIPLVMDHFVERFNVQPFIIHDENHDLCGVYDGEGWQLVRLGAAAQDDLGLPPRASEEALMQDAWKRFYRSVSIDARYNPELRRHFMAKRFWKNITEMKDDIPALRRMSQDQGAI